MEMGEKIVFRAAKEAYCAAMVTGSGSVGEK